MANFLINSPSSETVGTNSNDLFVLSSLQGNTVFGLEGNDTITSNALAASAVVLNAGAGNDIFVLTGGLTYEGSVLAGSGSDSLSLGRDFSAAVIRGGSGNDTIEINAEGSNDRTTVNGNDGADYLSANVSAGSNSSFFAGGAGRDTLTFNFVSGANAFTINGGSGHDEFTINATNAGALSAFVVAGGDGFDTITFNANAAVGLSGSFNINGDELNDLITFQGAVTTIIGSATIGAGAGADTIRFSAGVSLADGYINAGEGLDSVYISGQFGAGTLNGGAGADSITLATFANSGTNGVVFGDAGADFLQLGTRAAIGADISGATVVVTAGSLVGYSNFDQSNINGFDTISASLTNSVSGSGATVSLFKVRETVVNLTSVGATQVQGIFSAQAGANVLFNGTFDGTVTARATELDKVLTQGMAVTFLDGANNNYVFVQGGSASSGTSGDLLIKVNANTALAGLTVQNNSSLVVLQSAVFG